MAWVILSAGKLTQSKVRTVSLRTTLVALSVSLFIVAAAAFMLGIGIGRSATEPAPMPAFGSLGLRFDQPERRVLIDRVGELSGRLVRLESEATNLAKRIGVLQEFEDLQQSTREAVRPSVFEGARPATPAGGPMIPPLGGRLMETVPDDHGIGLANLERDIERIDIALDAVVRATDERNLKFMTFPSRSPAPGAVRNSGFGNRVDPFNRQAAFHSGLDFSAPPGTPIIASAGGKVLYSGYRIDYGYTIEIDHGNDLVTRYAHCSRLLVEVGDVVTPGQRIALIGSSGRSTGPHLHFEVLKGGRYSDPELYLASN